MKAIAVLVALVALAGCAGGSSNAKKAPPDYVTPAKRTMQVIGAGL